MYSEDELDFMSTQVGEAVAEIMSTYIKQRAKDETTLNQLYLVVGMAMMKNACSILENFYITHNKDGRKKCEKMYNKMFKLFEEAEEDCEDITDITFDFDADDLDWGCR